MRARFLANAQVPAGLSPFRSMRWNPAPAGAKLSEQMRQLVPQGAVDLGLVMLAQTRIQRNESTAKIRSSRGTEKARVPFHLNRAGQFLGSDKAENFPGLRFKGGVASQDDERRRRREDEAELAGADLVVRFQGAAV